MKKLLSLMLIFSLILSLLSVTTTAAAQTNDARIVTEHEANTQFNALLNSFRTEDGTISYPDYYGGAFLNEDGKLVVNVTTQNEYIVETIRTATENDEIIINNVDYSYNYLLELQNQIVNYVNNGENRTLAEKIISTAVFDNSNDMTIGMEEVNSDIISEFLAEVFPDVTHVAGRSASSLPLSLPLSFVLEEDSKCSAEPAATTDAQQTRTTLFYAGDQVNTDSLKSLSVGFPCYYWEGGVCYRGFVTAAHGCKLGDRIYDSVTNAVIGTVEAYQYSGTVDAAFVAITNNSYPLPTTIEAIFDDGTTRLLETSIGASIIPAVGSTIYKDGYVTNCTSGTITSTSASFNSGGIMLTDLIQTTADIDKGDSGGIGFTLGSGNYTYKFGIVEGYTHILGIQLKGYFIKYTNIRDELGITFDDENP